MLRFCEPKITGCLLRKIRLAAFYTMAKVKEQLTNTDKTVGRITRKPDSNHPSHVSRTFKKVTGMTPGEYRVANCNR